MIYIVPILILFILVITARTIMSKPRKVLIQGPQGDETTGESAVKKLSRAVKIATVSSKANDKKPNVFDQYHKLLENLFPRFHKTCTRKKINTYTLIYRWKGKDSSKQPVLMTAHMDVVPIEESTRDHWEHPPFSGDIADDYVWGRGTLDTKVTQIMAMEAAELLIKDGFIPERDIYFAFGHDEEIGGYQGAVKAAEYFKKQGIQFEFLLDEGGTITTDSLKGVDKPLAVVGNAEKGYANIRITSHAVAGHSSRPPKDSALGILAKAIVTIERNPMPARMLPMVREFFNRIGPEFSGVNKVILANLWISKPLFMKIFQQNPAGNALLRTTLAFTMANAGTAENVLPEEATCMINCRIMPGETSEDIIRHLKKILRKLPVTLEVINDDPPSVISSGKSEGFNLIEKSILASYGDVLVTPYLAMARSDSKRYEEVCDNMYRFAPYMVNSKELEGIHGVNERISIDNIRKGTQFYLHLLRNC